MNNSKKYVGVETVLNVFDQNRLWYYIPSFNGYEVSNDGYLRSMKHYRKYPYGILISPKKGKGEQDPIFELSDNNNERQRIHLSQLMYMALNNPYKVAGYPRLTIVSDSSSRNDRHFVKKKPKVPPLDNTVRYAKFTVIQDGTERPGMEKKDYEDYKVPLVPLNKNDKTYYGRQDVIFLDPE